MLSANQSTDSTAQNETRGPRPHQIKFLCHRLGAEKRNNSRRGQKTQLTPTRKTHPPFFAVHSIASMEPESQTAQKPPSQKHDRQLCMAPWQAVADLHWRM